MSENVNFRKLQKNRGGESETKSNANYDVHSGEKVLKHLKR